MLVAVLCNIACQFSFWCISVSLSLKWYQVSLLLQHCFQNIFGWKSSRYCNILPLTHSKSLSPQSPFCTFDTRQSAEIQDRGGVMQCDLCERCRRDHRNAPKTKTTRPKPKPSPEPEPDEPEDPNPDPQPNPGDEQCSRSLVFDAATSIRNDLFFFKNGWVLNAWGKPCLCEGKSNFFVQI